MDFISYVNDVKKAQFRENIDLLREEINQPWVILKIRNHVERLDDEKYTVESVQKMILEDDLVASLFAKNPNKQSIAERTAINLLNVRKLPQWGDCSVRFDVNGELVSEPGNQTTKAADFYINGYFVTCKYTEGSGGGQDNQRKDVVNFLTKGSLGGRKVCAILDGSYWESGHLEQLKRDFADRKNIVITSVTEITENGGLGAVLK